MAKNKDDAVSKIEELKAELKSLKGKKKNLDKKPKTTKTKKNAPQVKEKIKDAKKEKKKAETTTKVEKKAEKKKKKKAETTKKVEKKAEKKEKKKAETTKKVAKKTKEEIKEEQKTLEEQLEEELSDSEIENFRIEKVDMEKLTHKVCDILAERESSGMIQSELWKKLKLTSRDGSRLALKLERMGNITREKILEKGRWTYKLLIKKTPISTTSIENAPCLICPVEQRCSLDGEISPRTCQWIEEWVTTNTSSLKKAQ